MNPQNPDPKDSLLNKFIRSPARFFIAVVLILILFFVVEAVSADDPKPGLIRTTLMENPVELSSKSVNAKVIRVTFPPAFKTPWHTHEGPGPRYVVKGKLKVTEDGKVNTYSIGEVFWESGKLMAVENVATETAELIIFELAPTR
ncbi:cupin domain-containing protein [Methyloglobulus sp.]|uniref:cupin domain-containing protein n=1 Tax=Methyloglobulus sp. TaxID=2518622 RepID=UPI003989858F